MQFDQLKRREFIALVGGAVAWPLAAHAQLSARVRCVGAMMLLAEDDPMQKPAGLQEAGYTDRNTQIDYRWGAGDATRAKRYATELVALAPDMPQYDEPGVPSMWRWDSDKAARIANRQ